jgi:hypothetical protein
MLRKSSTPLVFRRTSLALAWTAEDGDPNAPDTTFKNVKPNLFLRWWRQVRQRSWMIWSLDEEWISVSQESFIFTTRMEQLTYFPTSTYGSVPGSYSDPVLYNTKTTSPFRWHSNPNNFDVAGHWYMEADELFRLKDWKPKNPDDPFEMFPRPPQVNLSFEETVDAHGNRTFKYKYKYDFTDPHARAYPAYPFSHLYGGMRDNRDLVEGYGFKQGELLRCDKEEEEVLRRVLEEEDKEWDMVKRTELIQEPWMYPGKVRGRDLQGSIDRAKARWKQAKREGRPTDPTKDPNYDLVQAGEFVEPRDGPRAEWRHLWTSNRTGPLDTQTSGNDGQAAIHHEGKPPAYRL